MNNVLQKGKNFLGRKNSLILTCASVIGVIGVAVIASKDSMKARDAAIEFEMEHENDQESRELKIELVKKVVPCYFPTITVTGITIASVVASHVTSSKRVAAYSSAITIAQEAATLYRDKVKEVVGENKAKEIDDKVAEQNLSDHPYSNSGNTLVIGDGEYLCFDTYSARYFKSTTNRIEKAINHLNFEARNNMWFSLNQYYDDLGLEPVSTGEEMGWTSDYLVEAKFSTKLMGDGNPCVVVDFNNQPVPDSYCKY